MHALFIHQDKCRSYRRMALMYLTSKSRGLSDQLSDNVLLFWHAIVSGRAMSCYLPVYVFLGTRKLQDQLLLTNPRDALHHSERAAR